MNSPVGKYRSFPAIHLPDRQWPNRTLEKAPQWCSVDLRDGNQALAQPMNVSQKLEMFDALVRCGFKEIEVGFPAASSTEFEFVRRLIEDERIPDDVTIQVLVQAREELIEPTMRALVGAKRVIIHLYNSTSPAQRRVVFGLEKADIVKIATRGTQWIKDRLAVLVGTQVTFEYSPESFSATEVEFSLEICEAVMNVWGPTPGQPIILNLPETVEVAMPNVYADQIEWFCRNLKRRDCAIISIHTHNDRGTGVASTELGLLAGADRVEGTLFGNGERTGNLDIITVALNLHMHGIDCGLDFADLSAVEEVYERCTGMSVDPRHPYAGELVFTAFSGSHQDAIKKALAEWKKREGKAHWDVPYLAIDPHDIGRTYSEVIRVNSQSGKGGVAYLLESKFGIDLPKEMQREFGPIANDAVDGLGREVSAEELKSLFWREYIERQEPYVLKHFHSGDTDGVAHCQAHITHNNQQLQVAGTGNGPIAAFVRALQSAGVQVFEVCDYREQAMGRGVEASAIAYICIRTPDGKTRWGAGVDTSIELASIKAVLSALNRL
ncbi:MAG: leuA [Phycisphaerales bacterium]|nr:leuA [Phycisphaerales bacterium]